MEWRAIENISGIYSPRVDIAVGPFSVIRGGTCSIEHDQLVDDSQVFLKHMIRYHRSNVARYRNTDDARIDEALHLPSITDLKYHNRNARCFLAIEIENRVSRKHLLGGAVNAAALGRVGVVVGWNEEKVAAIIKLQAYWDFLGTVGKPSYPTKNLLILSPEQLRSSINAALTSQHDERPALQ